MLKIRCLFLMISVMIFSACERNDSLTNSEVQAPRNLASLDLLKITQQSLQDLDSEQSFNLQTCPTYLAEVYKIGLSLDPRTFNLNRTQQDWKEIYQNLWLIRLKMNEKLKSFHASTPNKADGQLKACVNSMRNAFRLSRYVEDYLAELFGGEKPDFDQPEDFKPLIPTPFQKGLPWTVVSPKRQKVTLRSGDLITSRGNAYSSAAISRIVEVDSQFSHLAMIYVPSGPAKEYSLEEAIQSKDVLVLEAHIEVGSTIRPFQEYAQDGNARNLLFRYDNPALAHRAAKKTFEYLEKFRKVAHQKAGLLRGSLSDVNYAVPYDFKMELQNADELFCSEVGYYGFQLEGIQIPTFISDINPKLDLVKRLGITGKQIFAPGDMELEPQFEMIAEFRNLRKLKGIRMKDMALSSFLTWMADGYEFSPIPMSVGQSMVAWLSRQLDLKFVKKKLPKNMNITILNTIFTLDNVTSLLEKELVRHENEYKSQNQGLLLTYPAGLDKLEALKQADRTLYLQGKKPLFHWEFRPSGLQPKPNPNKGG